MLLLHASPPHGKSSVMGTYSMKLPAGEGREHQGSLGPWSPPHEQSCSVFPSHSLRPRDAERMGERVWGLVDMVTREDMGQPSQLAIQEGPGRVRKDTLSLGT